MKISDILEHQNIQEGPLDTIGTAVGKTVGGVAKAAGAVAGGVAGIGTAVKKGFQAGKRTVGGDPAPQAAQSGQPSALKRMASTATAVGKRAKSAGNAFKAGWQGSQSGRSGKEIGQDIDAKKPTAGQTGGDPRAIMARVQRLQKPEKIYLLDLLKR